MNTNAAVMRIALNILDGVHQAGVISHDDVRSWIKNILTNEKEISECPSFVDGFDIHNEDKYKEYILYMEMWTFSAGETPESQAEGKRRYNILYHIRRLANNIIYVRQGLCGSEDLEEAIQWYIRQISNMGGIFSVRKAFRNGTDATGFFPTENSSPIVPNIR